MLPTVEQARQATHARWIKNGRPDGYALGDWVGAEQDLAFAMNYREIALYYLDEPKPQYIGSKPDRKCRYCGVVPPAKFRILARAIPELIGNRSLIANDECDECTIFFSEAVEDSLAEEDGVADANPARHPWEEGRAGAAVERQGLPHGVRQD